MEDPNPHRECDVETTPIAAQSSIARRREILKLIGQTSAVAGAASPIAALAGNNTGRPWCYQAKNSTTPVVATISGVGSVLMSAQTGTRNFGYSCGYYQNTSNIPSNCQKAIFKDVFSCSGKDSLGTPMSNSNCLFNQSLSQILTGGKHKSSQWMNSAEAHWATAYINSTVNYPSNFFPYSTAQVSSYFSDVNNKAAAYSFFTGYMENG